MFEETTLSFFPEPIISSQKRIMKRFAAAIIALVNVLRCCHATNTSIKAHKHWKHRRHLGSKSSKASQNHSDSSTWKFSSKSTKINYTGSFSSKSSKTSSGGSTNIFEYTHDNTVPSPSTKSAKTNPSKISNDTPNVFEVEDGAFASSTPSRIPSAAAINTSTVVDEPILLEELAPPTNSPVRSIAPPTNAPLLSSTITTPPSVAIKIMESNLQATSQKSESAFLFDDVEKPQEIHWATDNSVDHSTSMAQRSNNVVLAYGLISASLTLILATVGLIASRRRVVVEERRKSIMSKETASASSDDLS